MSQQKVDKLLKELQTEVSQLEQIASTARSRTAIAQHEADNLEDRNKLAVKAIEEEVESKKQVLLADFKKDQVEFNSQIEKLKVVKINLQDEVSVLNDKKLPIQTEISESEDKKLILEADLQDLVSRSQELDTEIAIKSEEITALQAKHDDLSDKIASLEDYYQSLDEDIAILQTESVKLENSIIGQDAEFKSRKTLYDKELTDVEDRLKATIDKLLEAENKDRAIRESWAEGQLKLDKRERVVRKREVLVADSDSKLRQQDDFMKI